VYRCCGIIGIDPTASELTLQALLDMVHGRREEQWWHTAAITSTVVNMLRDPKSSPVRVEEMHPMIEPPVIDANGLAALIGGT